ncbi:amino acid permease [Staphylococcus warneri]|jgi:D-serine/D-alanine/glycine transporter|uniref:Amino acid permease n=3 Tax=Staphylococcus warneri TaxID=1292 RepID=A0A364UQ32_STAWA|nr:MULTISPECIES: amino acid permease [Staphylococcus]MBJ7886402.1 amino acid permease [Bacillaceae bacterium HSR45]PAK74229.1 gamma-aminobutyrate permease [Staphylococcus pasteuri]POO69053.1 gamma-aminobutyrate permease [Bacillus amyloliquefaciens]AGC90379.1 putative D-serine/D-alanine/glycine transporter [Staphylococcus warneri SG1]AXZ23201.1 amino acid permease [Staphylococcus warneri]
MADNLQRELSNRHVQLIAIGGAIGTGLFLGAGQTIAMTGPSILLTYIFIGFMLFMFMRGLGEIIIQNTNFKSFADVTNTYIGPFAGFVTGWTYWLCWIITGMAEVTAVAKYVSFWFPHIPNWISALFCVLILMSFNLLSAKLFGELEFWFSIVKIVTIIGLIIVGAIMILFAYKTQFGHASLTNLYNHGIFPKGASGFFMSFQMAVFSFVGIEMIGVTAGETKDPESTIPKAINSVPIRILIFYVGALAVIMSIIPWDKVDPDNSPFVKLFTLIGIPFAAGLINFVVLTAAASSCNSGIFSNSRMLFGLSDNKQAPPAFSKTNKNGVPHVAIIGSSALLLIAALLNYIFPDATLVFTYVTTLSTVLFLIVWALIIIAYINYSSKNPELHKASTYKLPGGKYMGYVILLFFILVFGLLFVNETTRRAIYLTPLWFVLLGLMYWRYKKASTESK